jgi:uncharacterized protein (TIGR00251 family)
MSEALELRTTGEGVVLAVRVHPKGGRDRIAGAVGGRLKVSVSAPPEGGKANAAVVRLLAKRLGVGRGRVRVVSGETCRDKQVLLAGCEAEAVRRALGFGGSEGA